MSRIQHTAYVASNKLIDASKLKKTGNALVVEALIAGQEVVPAILASSHGGMVKGFDRFVTYCNNLYEYPPPLIEHHPGLTSTQKDAIKAYLEAKHGGSPVTLIYADLGAFSQGWHNTEVLQNTFTDRKGTPYRLDGPNNFESVVNITMHSDFPFVVPSVTVQWTLGEDIETHVPYVGSLDTNLVWDPLPPTIPTNPPRKPPNSPFFMGNAATSAQNTDLVLAARNVRDWPSRGDSAKYAISDPVFTFPAFAPDNYATMQYKVMYSVGGVRYVFTTLEGSGLIPGLDVPDTPVIANDRCSPILVLMLDKKAYNTDPKSSWARTTDKASKLLGLAAKDLLDEVNKADSNGTDKADIFLHFGVGIDPPSGGSNESVTECEYCVDFFRYITLTQSAGKWGIWFDAFTDTYITFGTLNLNIGGSLGFAAGLGFRSLTLMDLAVPKGTTKFPNDFFGSAVKAYNLANQPPGYPKPVNTHWAADKAYYFYTRKSDTHITVAAVANLNMLYHVNIPGYPNEFRYVEAHNREALYIPLHNYTYNRLTAARREILLQKALRLTLFLTKTTKLKWYQTDLFMVIAMIVAVLVIAYMPQLSAWLAGVTGVSAATALVIVKMAVSMLVSFAAPLFGEMGWLFSLVMAAMVNPAMLLNPMQSLASYTTLAGWGTGIQLVANVASAVSTVHGLYAKKVISDITKEMEDLAKTAKEKQEELEAKWYALADYHGGTDLDVIGMYDEVRRIREFIYESPTVFFQRSLNPHPGLEGVPMISNWVSTALTLSYLVDGTLDYTRNVVESVAGQEHKWIG